jgi:2-amino-4-hydroxy-6-hydroxymethyldihydropteridine diphosphokinase
MKHTVYLLTGSNIGDSFASLQQAKQAIHLKVGEVVSASSIYKTEPWGNKDQQDFLNQVLNVDTSLEPIDVLKTVLQIEQEMGRNRIEKWGPRIIDIDILFYDELIMETNELKIPHPFLHERRFTLMPLNEIAPELVHPLLNLPVSSLLAQCSDHSVVEKM